MDWLWAFRAGVAPCLKDEELEALAAGLEADDPALVQGATTVPPPMECVADWPAEGACAIGYAGWKGAGLGTVGEVEEFFARVCYEADKNLNEPAGCRWFLNPHDELPREEMRAQLLGEVRAELARRRGG